MTKYRVSPDSVADKWSWVIKKANRKCHDTAKTFKKEPAATRENIVDNYNDTSENVSD